MTAPQHLAPLALTQGDPSGIGPEIALRAWHALRHKEQAFFLLGDPAHMQRVAARLRETSGLDVPIQDAKPQTAASVFAHALPVVFTGHAATGAPGASTGADAPGTIAAIEQAAALIASGQASAMVTNPITKDSLYRTGFNHPGHTEFLGELAQKYFAVSCLPVMMIWSGQLAVVPVTIHVALHKAIGMLTSELIVQTARIAAQDLREKFAIAAPRLAVSGLNPHAGENGAMGDEDQRIIAPAIAQLRKDGIDARGPLPADTMFHAAARANYDVAI
ncbi:MAG: 4-hydroxythreonine-4-phosphate dehydrogenase, partial [Alphaproteobacteria bacterium]|nr:4-hydroxythreonine-4-phosphate dehydrogenase [Alphaproteobacteria bacterium]